MLDGASVAIHPQAIEPWGIPQVWLKNKEPQPINRLRLKFNQGASTIYLSKAVPDISGKNS
ncbi:hypothetical protein [Calothrix sp. PCC 6303]|uniref:hypothetical protein n=1 Tax=Calothrix sp. PCC 6303 TaxID=1170562 RepID=UPI0002A05894|nr:hypothetical protein [Calothrix sp. PCC 6303]AFZ00913.1 hypothetical protein Cal6303_1879 [Calothrix sp. PCC 6303]